MTRLNCRYALFHLHCSAVIVFIRFSITYEKLKIIKFVKRTVFVVIEKTLLKMKKCDVRPNNARYEKTLTSEIVHLKKIYKFDFDNFR